MRNEEGSFVPTAISAPGFMLLDGSFHPLVYNSEAIAILSFPTKPEQIKQLPLFLTDKVRSSLLNRQKDGGAAFVREYRSGRRMYLCRAFSLDACEMAIQGAAVALLLERHHASDATLLHLQELFDLTERERETVGLLMEGLTSKEIANRMNISPNTVKAFLRLVMLKMSVSTRSGIVGKIVESKS
jgi:DNA-binding CsgD family transcriptional regulator